MEILGIGLPELFFIILLVLILINPKDMRETGLTFGRWLNKMVRSDAWKAVQDIQKLPTQLMREANLEDLQREIGSITNVPPTARPNIAKPDTTSPAQINIEAQGYSQPLPASEKPAPTAPDTQESSTTTIPPAS